MKKLMKKSGFTLVEIMIVVAIIGLLAAIGIPSFQRARTTSQTKACINNLRIISSAKDQCAIESGDNSITDYLNYIKGGALPTCPAGGTYDAGALDANPTCTVANHVLP